MLDFIIKNSPQIVETRVKEIIIGVAKEYNIPDATEMNILVRNENDHIVFLPHYNRKQITKLPFSEISGNIGSAVEVLVKKIFKKEAIRHELNPVFISFIMQLQTNGVVLVWPYHRGIYGNQMRINEFLAL